MHRTPITKVVDQYPHYRVDFVQFRSCSEPEATVLDWYGHDVQKKKKFKSFIDTAQVDTI